MAIPSVNMLSNLPGGAVPNVMDAHNTFANNAHLRKINAIKEFYAPITSYSDAASKLAYANLMGPQFMAKLMGNDSALANMSEDQKRDALQRIYGAAQGNGSGNALGGMPGMPSAPPMPSGIGQPSTNSFSGHVSNALRSVLDMFHPSPSAKQNSLALGGSASNPSQYNAPPGMTDPQSPMPSNPDTGDANTINIPDAFNYLDEWQKSPEGMAKMAQEGPTYYPDEQELSSWAKSRRPMGETMLPAPEKTYAEKTGEYKGVVEEGLESGKIRAKNIEELNNVAFNADTAATTLDDLSKILSSPTIEKIRQVPLLGHHELAYYAKEGTPEEQNLVGRYYTDTGNIIKDSARDFAGQFRKGEQQLLNSMKANPADTVDAARGKVESLAYFNKMLGDRSKLTSKYMTQRHINKLQASELADRQIDGESIRKQIHAKLNPTVTIRNSKTGETKTISIAEARKLGVPNV